MTAILAEGRFLLLECARCLARVDTAVTVPFGAWRDQFLCLDCAEHVTEGDTHG